MKPSSSTSEPPGTFGPAAPPGAAGEPAGAASGLFDGIFTTEAVAAAVSDQAWLQAMLDVEAALAAAQARAGLVPDEAASAIAERCRAGDFDVRAIGRAAAGAGNPVVPLVEELTAAVPAGAAGYVHQGATSQDVLDTAAMLVTHRALGPILDDLAVVARCCAGLAERHRGTVIVGRTLLQHALPTTFGLKAAGWLSGVDESRERLATVREQRLAVQFGGAAGTLASLGDSGIAVAADLAGELGLAEPVLPWHTVRVRLGELAGALGTVAGALGKIARDVTLLAQTDVGEAAEPPAPGRGTSSTMPHKRNPVGSIVASACTQRVPGLVATLFGAMSHEHERAAGSWHAEWEPLTELLRIVGGAAGWLGDVTGSAGGLEVDAERMRANLDTTGGLLMAERVTTALASALGRMEAHELVRQACQRAVGEGRPLREVLLADGTVGEHLSTSEVDAALDPAGYLGSAGGFVDRALAAHRALEHQTGHIRE